MSIFKGSGVALITPFKEDLSVDYRSLEKMINYQIESGTDAIIICGTTGEAPTLDDEEHLNVIKKCVEIVDGKVPVIAGTGSNNTMHAVMMSKEAEKRGANGLLIVTPYYNKATQYGLVKHYGMIAKSTNLPILMYNVPSRTGCNIEPETAIKIALENENIVGIKEASGKTNQVEKILELFRDKKLEFDLYSGNDDDVVRVLENGGIGVISVCANVTPTRTHDLVIHYLDGDLEYANKLQDEQTELSDVLFSEVNPIPVKKACYEMGLIDSDSLRLPLTSISEENYKKLIKIMKKQKIIK